MSMADTGKNASANSLDTQDGPNVNTSFANFDRSLGGYTPPAAGIDAGGLTPQLTARTSISHAGSLDYRNKQLALLGPMRPQPTKIWKRKFVKLMVVGDSGLGKTTLISALLSKPGEQLQVRLTRNCSESMYIISAWMVPRAFCMATASATASATRSIEASSQPRL